MSLLQSEFVFSASSLLFREAESRRLMLSLNNDRDLINDFVHENSACKPDGTKV